MYILLGIAVENKHYNNQPKVIIILPYIKRNRSSENFVLHIEHAWIHFVCRKCCPDTLAASELTQNKYPHK
jgi:hypothetical protein